MNSGNRGDGPPTGGTSSSHGPKPVGGRVLVIAGPTASGKSALALAMAEEIGGVVINADSAQVYRELRVLTARPSAADEAKVPHRLFGVLPAAERCSAGRWLAMASAEIAAAGRDRRVPVVVGGTGLYLRVLTRGLAPIPEIPEGVRHDAEALHARLGGVAFRQALARLDPESAARLPASDRQRLVRAYEVVRATGRSIGDWQRAPRACGQRPAFQVLALLPSRDRLYAAIDGRFDGMLAAGAVAEVRRLLELGLDPGLPAMKAVGVRELAAYLRGEVTLAAAAGAAKKASRTYAKRQITWIRHQLTDACVIDEQYSERFRDRILPVIRRFLLTPGP